MGQTWWRKESAREMTWCHPWGVTYRVTADKVADTQKYLGGVFEQMAARRAGNMVMQGNVSGNMADDAADAGRAAGGSGSGGALKGADGSGGGSDVDNYVRVNGGSKDTVYILRVAEGRPPHHTIPHQHIFEYNPDKGGWIRKGSAIFEP